LIDATGKVLLTITDKKAKWASKSERAFSAGEEIAKSIKSIKINTVIFDRNWYLYHGRVKAFADGVRKWWINL
jgi:large subunit ribosomal protein L18